MIASRENMEKILTRINRISAYILVLLGGTGPKKGMIESHGNSYL